MTSPATVQLENEFLRTFSDTIYNRYLHSMKLIEQMSKGGEPDEGDAGLAKALGGLDKALDSLGAGPSKQSKKLTFEEEIEMVDHIIKNQERIYRKVNDLQLSFHQRMADSGVSETLRSVKKAKWADKQSA